MKLQKYLKVKLKMKLIIKCTLTTVKDDRGENLNVLPMDAIIETKTVSLELK